MSPAVPSDPLATLEHAITAACGRDLEAYDEPVLARQLDRLHRAQARLAAERARLTAELERRRLRTIGDARDRERARQYLQRDLADRSNRQPAQTKLDSQAGTAARQHPATGRCFASGDISAEHVRLVASVLDTLPAGDERDELEQDLLARARHLNPTAFGRYTRDLLARQLPATVTLREERQQRERRVTLADTPDGGLTLSGLLHGTAAETVRTAVEAFRRPDASSELRTPAQRTADALEQVCAVALRAGAAATSHGIRPQVLVTVTTDQIELGPDGIANLGSGEASTLGRLRHLLDDCSWARVVLGPDGAPLEASESVRTVPHGLWRALLARDQGCTWPGCDAPANWCDVAHGNEPFAAGGRLSPDNAALLCRRHHRRFDHGDLRIRIDGAEVRYVRRQQVTDEPRAAVPPTERSGCDANGPPPAAAHPPSGPPPPATADPPSGPPPPATADPPSGAAPGPGTGAATGGLPPAEGARATDGRPEAAGPSARSSPTTRPRGAPPSVGALDRRAQPGHRGRRSATQPDLLGSIGP
ncbi:MAG: DUF222 domain-containing protein [Nitriliruptoraceae bacterium]